MIAEIGRPERLGQLSDLTESSKHLQEATQDAEMLLSDIVEQWDKWSGSDKQTLRDFVAKIEADPKISAIYPYQKKWRSRLGRLLATFSNPLRSPYTRDAIRFRSVIIELRSVIADRVDKEFSEGELIWAEAGTDEIAATFVECRKTVGTQLSGDDRLSD